MEIILAIVTIAGFILAVVVAAHQMTIGETIPKYIEKRRAAKLEARRIKKEIEASEKTDIPVAGQSDVNQVVILPRRHEPFINREEEIKITERLLKSYRVVQFRGLGGIGKTGLAIEVAYRIKDSFPDGVVHLSALDYSTFEDILNAIAGAFDIDVGQIPLKEKKMTINKALLRKRPLLIFDNVEEVRPIEEALDTLSQCAALITSRPGCIIPKADLLEIGPMAQEHAISLFESNCGRTLSDDERKIASEIVRRLEFPKAIEMAARQVQIARVTLNRLLNRINTALNSLEANLIDDLGVRASFLSTYELLSDIEKELFASLGTFGGRSFSIEAVVAVTLDQKAERRLDRLVELKLVEIEDRRYHLHPLLKLFAREKLTSAEPYRRMAGYFADFASKHRFDFSMLESERANIQEAINWSYNNRESKLAINITEALVGEDPYYGFLAKCGYWTDALMRIREAIQASAELSDVAAEARFNLALGLFNYWLGNNDEAREVYRLAQQRFEDAGDTGGLVHVYWQLGYIEDDEDYYMKAEELYRNSLALSIALGDATLISTSKELVGVIRYHRGDYAEARTYIEESLAESISQGNKAAVARSERRLAAVARRQAACAGSEESHTFIEEARRLLAASREAEQNERSIARSLRQLGLLEQLLKNYSKAKGYYAESLETFRRLGNRKGIAATIYNLGTVLEAEGNWDEAERCYTESLGIGIEIKSRSGIALNQIQLASLAKKRNDCPRALELSTEAVRVLEEIESPHLASALHLREEVRAACEPPKS